MNEKRLLCSYEPFVYDSKVIKESREQSDGPIILSGILQKADVLNQNGRIYPLNILEREIRNYQKFITERRSLGETDHPESSVVSLKNASILIREAYIKNGVVYGSLEILRTPAGQILLTLLEHDVKLGISSRGVGSTKKQGDYHVVQDDFQLICWDMVSEPSTPGAFMLPEGLRLSESELKQLSTYQYQVDKFDSILNDILAL